MKALDVFETMAETRASVSVHCLVFLSKLVPPDFGCDGVGVGVLAIGQDVGCVATPPSKNLSRFKLSKTLKEH